MEGTINDEADIQAFIKQFHPSFPIGTADRTAVLQYMQMSPLERSFVPFMVFIDRKGMIRAQYTGSDQNFFGDKQAENIRAEAEKLLAEKPATASPKGKRGAK